MKLKLDEKGNVVVVDGMPVFVYEDGKEVPFNAPDAVAKIKTLSDERDTLRTTSEKQAKALEGIKDLNIEDARKALETVKNLDTKKLVDAGEIEKVKAEIGAAYKVQIEDLQKSYQKKMAELETGVKDRDEDIFSLRVTNRFATSKYITDKLTLPPDLVEARFGKQFKVEDKKVVAYDLAGNKIYSRKNPGVLADVDEALEVIVDGYPEKARILKGSGASGSGMKPGGANGGAHVPDMSGLSPEERIKTYRNANPAAAKK